MIEGDPLIEVGHAIRTDLFGYEAGVRVATEALGTLHLHRPSAVLVFASALHDVAEVMRGVGSVVKGVPVFGGSTAAEIANGWHHGGVLVTVLASPFLSVSVGVGEAVSRDWSAAVDQAISAPGVEPLFGGDIAPWRRLTQEGKSAFAFVLSPGETKRSDALGFEIIEALKRRSLGRLPIFGMGTAVHYESDCNHVFSGDRAIPDGLVVATFETQLRFGIAMAHGLRPTADRATVTAVRGREVLELDRQPAADVYAKMLGVTREALEGKNISVSTGIVCGLPGPVSSYHPNVASTITPEGGVRFSMPVPPGSVLARMSVDAETSAAAGREVLNKAMARAGIAHPAIAIANYCGMRQVLLGDAASTEVPHMMEALGKTPLIGFTSYGEQGLSDDGVPVQMNCVIGTLVIGNELSQTAFVAHENEGLRRKADALRQRTQEELEQLVAERTAQLTNANQALRAEIEERRRHQRALRTLSACNEALVRAGEEGALFKAICRVVVDVGGYRMSWVGLAEHDDAKTIRPAGWAGIDEGYLAALRLSWADVEQGWGPAGTAIRTGRPMLIREIATAPEFAPWRAEAIARGYASVVAVPLASEGSTFGVLVIYAAEVDAFDADEMRLLSELADDLAFGVMALRGREERSQMTVQLTQADRLVALGTLAAGVAHEINNPLAYALAGLHWISEGIVRSKLDPDAEDMGEIKEVLQETRAGLDRIRHVVHGLKVFSRSDEVSCRALDVAEVLDSSAKMASNEIRHRARLVKEYGPTPMVEANESRLGQLFLNLLVNAAQAIPDGAMDQNEIRIVTRTDQYGRAVVEIHDTGCGISPEDAKRIFDPFFTTKPIGVGTGLGLAICHSIATSFGGELTAQSELDKGSIFRLALPSARKSSPEAEDEERLISAGRHGRLLVVDDEPFVARAIQRSLSRDHDVVAETSAQAALQRVIAGEQFDLIICDLMMPQMGGAELYAEVARIAPDLAGRVVFLSGGAFTAKAKAFLEAVKNPFVSKPFDPQVLRSLVWRLLSRAA